MMRNIRHLVLAAGLLGLIVLLSGCRPQPVIPVKAEPAGAADPTATSRPTETAEAAPTLTPRPSEAAEAGTARGNEEGFTAEGQPFRGNPDADVIIEDFSSFQCPFCAKYFRETYPQVMANYVQTGQVLYVFRDYPLPSQPQSSLAAEAANCAGQVAGGGGFWAMHDRLLEGQSEWSGRGGAASIFKQYGVELGLEAAAFDSCLDSGKMGPGVEADASEGTQRGVRGTPTFFINGQPLVGAQPYSVMAQAIDAALAGDLPAAVAEPAPVAQPTPAAIAPANDAMVLGDPSALVTIVEFSDYQCPFCGRYFEETWPQIQEEFVDTGRVRYVFKDFPLTSIHPPAAKAHEAARCAGDQETYWPMHDRLFAAQSEWAESSSPEGVMKRFAAELGLDPGEFAACLDGGRWAGAVQEDMAEGERLGVQGTPTFFIGGYPLVGAQPFSVMAQAIDAALAGDLPAAVAAPAPIAEPTPAAIAPANDTMVLGDPSAPVTIVEFSDYQCPFCGRYFSETWPQLREEFVDTGRVRYVFKDFPLTSIHPPAAKAHEAARCAGDQGAYWQMHDRLFEDQSEWAQSADSEAVLRDYAAGLGLDTADFDTCLDSGRWTSALQEDMDEGERLGVQGTPTFFVDGYPLVGAQPFATLQYAIELAEQGTLGSAYRRQQ